MEQENTSDVAKLRAEISAEYESARLGLQGASRGSSQHQFITARMERIGKLYDELKTVDKDATTFLMQALDHTVHMATVQPDLQVGDRVEVVQDWRQWLVGKRGVITEIIRQHAQVDFDKSVGRAKGAMVSLRHLKKEEGMDANEQG